MNSVETEGRTIDEAVAAALAQLQVERDRVEIETVTQPTKGFLGIGGKKARVRVTLRVPVAQPVEAPSPAGRRREASRTPAPRTPAPRAPVPVSVPAEPLETLPLHPEQGEKANEILQEILRHMGAQASVVLDQQANEAVLTLTGKDSATLIGRNGHILDALEYLLNRIVTRSEESDAHLTLDAEGYRERLRRNLENLALRLGERAKRRKRPVALSPLSPRDRRVIHLALEGDPLISTQSVGRGYFRRLYIVPEEGPRRERSRGGPRMLSGDA
ncbi:MAG: Jag N-terminal domain-containing protein [Deltaproteobacteria bacterium]|nr:Jag N-terminal domain-containing protein [Deltaproteobacteria bacterium]